MQHNKETAVLEQYFQQKTMNPLSQSLEQPIKELMDLNVKALQNLSYMMPTELLLMRRPDEVMEKNMQMFIENSHATLNYMHNMFTIMEKQWLKNMDGALQNTKENATHAKEFADFVSSQASKNAQRANKSSSVTSAKPKTSSVKSKSSTAKSAVSKKQPVKHASTVAHKDDGKSTVKHAAVKNSHSSSSSSHPSASSSQTKTAAEQKKN